MNTFHFDEVGPASVSLNGLADAVRDFYNTAVTLPNGAHKLTEYLNTKSFQPVGALTVKLYNMSDPPNRVQGDPPRLIAYQESYSLSNLETTGLPHEVALCLSYRAAPTANPVAGRRRGRIYIGPLNTAAISASNANGSPLPDGDFALTVMLAAQRLADDADAAGAIWSVHSPSSGQDAAYPIAEFVVDNAWDTQRRRGLKATVRVWEPRTV